MSNRKTRLANKRATKRQAPDQPLALAEADRGQMDANSQQAGAQFVAQVLPGIEAFRAFMATENRKVEVALFLDHIEGPQIIVHLSRQDGRITATLHAAVTPHDIEPYWDVRSTGRVKTHWTEPISGGLAGLTRDHVLAKLTELYRTDFS